MALDCPKNSPNRRETDGLKQLNSTKMEVAMVEVAHGMVISNFFPGDFKEFFSQGLFLTYLLSATNLILLLFTFKLQTVSLWLTRVLL